MKKSRKRGHVGLLNIFLIYNIEELWAYLATSDQAQLTFTHIQKINFTPQLNFKIEDIRESCNLIGREHLGQ